VNDQWRVANNEWKQSLIQEYKKNSDFKEHFNISKLNVDVVDILLQASGWIMIPTL